MEQRIDDGLLKLRGEIGARPIVQLDCAARDDDSGLESAETEIESRSIEHRSREFEACRRARFGELRERRTAGIRQAQELCGLVEGLTGGVIDRAPENLVVADPANRSQQGMSARHKQRQEWKLRRLGFEHRGEQMPF